MKNIKVLLQTLTRENLNANFKLYLILLRKMLLLRGKRENMILKSGKMKVISKSNERRVSSRTGKEYTDNCIFCEGEDNLTYTMHLVSDYVYIKALENHSYFLKYYLDTNGRLTLNGLEEVK